MLTSCQRFLCESRTELCKLLKDNRPVRKRGGDRKSEEIKERGSQLGTPQLVTSGVRTDASDRCGIDRAAERVVREFAPDIKVKLEDDGKGSQTVASIEGKDAVQFEPCYLTLKRSQQQELGSTSRNA